MSALELVAARHFARDGPAALAAATIETRVARDLIARSGTEQLLATTRVVDYVAWADAFWGATLPTAPGSERPTLPGPVQ